MPHPVFLKLRPVLHEQTRLCSPHQAKIRNVEGNQRERLICQILSAGSFITLSRSFQAAVEASAYLGLLMWLVGKQTWRSSSMGLLHLGSTWDWSSHFGVCFVQDYVCMKNTDFSLLAGHGNCWTGPNVGIGCCFLEGLFPAHFSCRWLWWGMRLLGFLPVFAECVHLCSAAGQEGKVQRKVTAVSGTLKEHEREDLALRVCFSLMHWAEALNTSSWLLLVKVSGFWSRPFSMYQH